MPRLSSFWPFNNATAIRPSSTPTTCRLMYARRLCMLVLESKCANYPLSLRIYFNKTNMSPKLFCILYENRVSIGISHACSSPNLTYTSIILFLNEKYKQVPMAMLYLFFFHWATIFSPTFSASFRTTKPWRSAIVQRGWMDRWIDRSCVAFRFGGWIL